MKFTLVALLFVFALGANARSLSKRDTKSDLLAEVDECEQKAKIEIEKLTKDNQKATADTLQKQLDTLLETAKEFKTATGTETVKLLTDKLTSLLGIFKATLRVLTDQTNNKEQTIEKAEKLLSNADEEVQRLLSGGRLIPGDLLKAQANKLRDRIEALKKATDSLAMKTLEVDISLIMVRISADLRLLGFVASTAASSAPTSEPTSELTSSPTTQRIASSRAPTSKPTSAKTKTISTTH